MAGLTVKHTDAFWILPAMDFGLRGGEGGTYCCIQRLASGIANQTGLSSESWKWTGGGEREMEDGEKAKGEGDGRERGGGGGRGGGSFQ